METFRKTDMRAEEQLAVFMDRCFYSKYKDKDGNHIQFNRIRDKKTQLNGVDIEILSNEKWIKIDEKASFYYSNAMIPTFAFEIDSIQKEHGNLVEGWFVNENLLTDYYMLIWPNIKCEKKDNNWVRKELKTIESTDFTIIESMLIKKERLITELQKIGYDKNYLVRYAKRIRQDQLGIKDMFSEELDYNMKITFSCQIPEKPINIVIPKSFLKRIASGMFLISEDGFSKI